jgi:hypothetical protein
VSELTVWGQILLHPSDGRSTLKKSKSNKKKPKNVWADEDLIFLCYFGLMKILSVIGVVLLF